ncbi:MAG: ABC transporter substrate-binding protein [Alphaproteobacteria bacterium]|nr:ABC transporter substrate-binding protein [Alphaproteobacteria bacterium]
MNRRDLLKLGALGSLGSVLPWDGNPASLSGARAQTGGQPRRGGTLTYALTPEPATLFTANTVSNPVIIFGSKINEALVRLDFDYNMQPVLAESWDISSDRLTWKFNLRGNAKWHDGRDFTSGDVAFTCNEVWKKLHGRGINSFRNVAAVETPDPKTVIFKLSAPIPFLHTVLSAHEGTVVARHIYEGTNILNNPVNVRPIGTGPFLFREWARGSHLIVDRNPNYWDPPKPYLDRIIFRLIPDAAGRAAALENGEILLAGPNPVPLGDTERLGRVPHLEVFSRGQEYFAALIYLQFNMDHPILGRAEVRRALHHAINQEFLARNVMFGFGSVATGPISPEQKQAYTADVPRYPFDEARANALLDQAGLPRGAGGVRFSITLDAYTLGEHYVRIGEYLRQAFGRVGVRTTIRTEEPAAWVRRIFTNYDYDCTTMGAVLLADPTVGMQRFFYSGSIRQGLPFSNASKYRNARVDQLFDLCQVEGDPARRASYWHEIQRIIQTDLPLISLANWHYTSIANKRVRDWVVSPHAMMENWAGVWLES